MKLATSGIWKRISKNTLTRTWAQVLALSFTSYVTLSKILKEATTCINWEWWHTSVIQAG
jgi:hypothetical protein